MQRNYLFNFSIYFYMLKDKLETKLGWLGWGGMDMCRDGMQSTLVKGCCAWSCLVKGEGEDQRQGSWMWQERTYKWLECQIGIWWAGEIGDCRSSVATPNGSSRKKKKIYFYMLQFVVLTNSCSVGWNIHVSI